MSHTVKQVNALARALSKAAAAARRIQIPSASAGGGPPRGGVDPKIALRRMGL